MLSRKEIEDIVDGIKSSSWELREKSKKRLLECRELASIINILNYINKLQDDALKFPFIHLLESILDENSSELCGGALYCLIMMSETDNLKVKHESEQQIDKFFISPQQYRYVKVLSIRTLWHLIPDSHRMRLTKIIGTYKVTEAVPFILPNLESDDLELVHYTVKILCSFKDTRGNRYLKPMLETCGLETLKIIVASYGDLGNFYDFLFLRKFLYHKDIDLRKITIRTLVKLMEQYSVYDLKKLYSYTDNIEIKKEIISRLSKVNNPKIVNFILKLFKEEKDSKLSIQVEWALHEFKLKFVLPKMIRMFKRTDDQTRFKIIGFFSEVDDQRCLSLLKKVISGKYNEVLKIAAMDCISVYDSGSSIDLISKNLKDLSSPQAYYALISLLRHTSVDITNLIETVLSHGDIPMNINEVILSAIKEKRKELNFTKIIINHLLMMLEDSSVNNQYLAVEACTDVDNVEIVRKVYSIYLGNSSEHVKDAAARTIASIIVNNPYLIKEMALIFSDEHIVDNVKIDDISFEFILNLCDLIKVNGWDSYLPFLIKNSGHIGRNLKKYIIQDINVHHVDTILEILDKTSQPIGPESLDHLVYNIYDKSDPGTQFLIMKMVVRSSEEKYLNFVMKNLVRNNSFLDIKFALMSEYMSKMP